jgi:tetratricopeptide (TPR) repeat protein
MAIGAAAILLHGQLADALVMRGDERLYRAQPSRALAYYQRALWLDPTDAVAVDRLLFVATTIRDRDALRVGIARASTYLARRPNDNVVRMDRAMAFRAIGQPARALEDFARVGRDARDVRALAFAGFAALAIGRPREARAYWRAALTLAPQFVVARHALARSDLER